MSFYKTLFGFLFGFILGQIIINFIIKKHPDENSLYINKSQYKFTIYSICSEDGKITHRHIVDIDTINYIPDLAIEDTAHTDIVKIK